MSSQEFIEDFRNIETAKPLLQVSIEAMLDICNHIIARNRWGAPDKSADSIRLLREKRYFSEAEEEQFAKMIKSATELYISITTLMKKKYTEYSRKISRILRSF